MLEGHKYENIIPGYTGFIPSQEHEEDQIYQKPAKSQIPGYAGYIPHVKAENMFGKTYGKTTFLSNQKMMDQGFSLPTDKRFQSMMKMNFIDQRDEKKKQAEILRDADQRAQLQQVKQICIIFCQNQVTGASLGKFFAVDESLNPYPKQENQEEYEKQMKFYEEERLQASTNNFFGDYDRMRGTQTFKQYEEDQMKGTLTYEQAKKIAYSIN